MKLRSLRRVLEVQVLSRSELVGFLVALFIEEDNALNNDVTAAETRATLARLRPRDRLTNLIWLDAVERLSEIRNANTTKRREG